MGKIYNNGNYYIFNLKIKKYTQNQDTQKNYVYLWSKYIIKILPIVSCFICDD